MVQPRQSHFKDRYSEVAAAYAAHRPKYPLELVEFRARTAPRRRLAWDCGCGSGRLAWDCGCGSGQLSVRLAERFERVIASDANAKQTATATPHPKVSYYCAAAEASGLRDGIVDLAVAAQAAHWFDLPAYYAEVRRVTLPGSIIALVTYNTVAVDDEIDPVVRHFYEKVLAPYWAPERRHVETSYKFLPFPFDEINAPQFEIREGWTIEDLLGYIETWSAVLGLEKAEGRAPIEAFRRKLADTWGAKVKVRSVYWPISLRIGRLG